METLRSTVFEASLASTTRVSHNSGQPASKSHNSGQLASKSHNSGQPASKRQRVETGVSEGKLKRPEGGTAECIDLTLDEWSQGDQTYKSSSIAFRQDVLFAWEVLTLPPRLVFEIGHSLHCEMPWLKMISPDRIFKFWSDRAFTVVLGELTFSLGRCFQSHDYGLDGCFADL